MARYTYTVLSTEEYHGFREYEPLLHNRDDYFLILLSIPFLQVFESSALVTLIKDLFHELYDAPVSHTSLSAGSADSYTLRPPTATLSIDHPDVNLFEINSAARLLNDHLSLTQPFTTSEFPTVEDSTIGNSDVVKGCVKLR